MADDIRLVIAEDHPLFRDALRRTFEKCGSMQVVAEAQDGPSALEHIRALAPDIALLDIGLPRMNGFAVVRALRQERSPVKVVFLTVHEDEATFEAALELDVRGYLLKDCTEPELVRCISAVAAGQHYTSPSMTTFLVNRTQRVRQFVEDTPGLQLLTPAIPTLTGLVLTGCYKIPAVKMEVIGVYTNKMATDAYRGAGRPEATYLIERLMDVVANEIGVDRVDIRLKHFPAPADFPFATSCGLTYDSGNYQGALATARDLVGWEKLLARRNSARAAGRLAGIGVSTYVEICAMGPSAAMPAGGWEWGCVRMEISGKVTVITGVSPHGQGQETSFAQITADRLGVPFEDVVVLHGDTNIAHFGRDTYGSRGTAVGGPAIVMCIDKIVAKAKTLAAHLLETTADHVEFANGVFSSPGVTTREIPWAELAGAAYIAKSLPPGFEPGLEASSFFEPQNFTFPFGTHICAVDVDRDTGQVSITDYVAVDDCGPQINPLLVEGQVQGGIAHSIGQALFEQTVYDENGQLLTGEFMDYPLPRAADIPDYKLGHTVTPSPVNPLGVKGCGEAGTIGATPAIANAVLDALEPLGIKHLDLPLTPERVWRAITEKGTVMANG